MGKKIDMTGWVMKEHGVPNSILTVLYEDKEYAKIHNLKSRATHWKCQCECGNYTTIDGCSLRSGNTLSCGCWNKKRQLITPSTPSTANNELMSIVLENITDEELKIQYPPQPIHPNAIDITGEKFGKLTALWKVGNQHLGHTSKPIYAFRCDCGKIKFSTSYMARSGQITTCGCGLQERGVAKRFKLLGQKFGRLTVLEELPPKNRAAQWLCQCECGNQCTKCTTDLTGIRQVKDCGICARFDIAVEKIKALNDPRNKEILSRPINTLVGLYIGKLYIYEDTNTTKYTYRVYKAKCECGSIIEYTLASLNGGTLSCGCINSRGEEKIATILTNNNIPFKKEHTYLDLKSPKNHALRYDFYIENKFLLEYDGEQHFQESQRDGYTLAERQEYDRIKNEYAKSHNIPLKRIPYWDLNKITLEDIMGDKYLIT